MDHFDPEAKEKEPLILIVDDVPKNLEVIGNILSTERYQLSFAVDGEKAWAILGRITPDLILLDIMMPGLDGYTLCRRIKALEDKKDIPVIFITARSSPEDLVKGFALGGVDYITKPFRAAELSARVRTHVALYRAQKKNRRLIGELRAALAEVKQLANLLPICSVCKKIRDDAGYWKQVEEYISAHFDVRFSHGICPDCIRSQYPEHAQKILAGVKGGASLMAASGKNPVEEK
jgi:CheY-like chemotaxis protein